MLRRLRVRTLVWLFFAAALGTGGAVGVYGMVRFVPAARTLRESTAALEQLYAHLAADQRAVQAAMALARVAAQRGDSASVRRLRMATSESDHLAGTLPLAVAPAPVRVPMARAADQTSRIALMLDDVASHLELGERRAAAAAIVAVEEQVADLSHRLDEVRAGGFEHLARGQDVIGALARELARAYAAWLALVLVLAGAGIVMFERRLARPLHALAEALGRVEYGDLTVTVPPGGRDEMGELAEHFNHMTEVLRDRAQRQGQIAAAGELLAGAAHEINNPLMAISASAENRAMDGALPPAVRGELGQIVAEARRAGQLLRAIVTFLRPHAGGQGPLDFNDVVRETWDLAWPQFRADGVVGRVDLTPDLAPVTAERHKLQQVFVNLLGNAQQALAATDPAQRRITVRTRADGDRVVAEIHDSGPGVPPGARDRLFRPFFTTHGGDRAGLGLYTSRLIARAFGGDVEFVASSGPGALFRVVLPAAPRPAPVVAPEPSAGRTGLAGTTILVVDDEPTVRRPVARYLMRRGARVLEAADGKEALGVALAGGVDLVLTDLRMPVMDGVAFYRELARLSPDMAARVLFLSGDVAQLQELGGTAIAPDRVLRKPVELAELEERLLAHRT